jgi:hypothetical protein
LCTRRQWKELDAAERQVIRGLSHALGLDRHAAEDLDFVRRQARDYFAALSEATTISHALLPSRRLA